MITQRDAHSTGKHTNKDAYAVGVAHNTVFSS